MNKIKAGIIGGAGYTGGELIRLLINHPQVDIVFIHSNSNAGNDVFEVHKDLLGDTDLKFSGHEVLKSLGSAEDLTYVDVLFLCVGHNDSKKFLETNEIDSEIKIIDLSQDFRLNHNSDFVIQNPEADLNPKPLTRQFFYGLPELNRESIKSAKNIANPGCFATCIQLGLLPLASKGLLKREVHVNATTGSTGAGQSLSATSHFSWRNNNLSVYKAFEHQHLYEISQSLNQLQADFIPQLGGQGILNFIPQRGDFPRGILASIYLECDLSLDEAYILFENFYSEQPFTHISKNNIDLKQVVNTNKCFIYLEKHGNKLFIISIIDNLLKGASGQALQNMNLMFGIEETTGLRLKATGF
ncbi:N-acetyl-gamma-glutamyl-phosphate reductase [Daejeonella oryzae]|uniref:N-acetyl-gamma-glutamyl-phosphate reductase n=1 Tax=Daejeonella oryzae TaxID=1122943 RepID=UPI0003FB46A2|nr:N-acetyl-gamma-glutamyl-phosphate reductase [Daejeonella oryzae]